MSGITFLQSADGHIPAGAVIRAGGTDLHERIRTGNTSPHIVDLTRVPGITGVRRTDGGTSIGACTTIATVARDTADDYPALALTACGLATPQIRAVGTIGGNLLQRTRCWYYRHPHLDCLKSGADECPARSGRHLYGVAFDRSACVHPHPSSLAMALLAHSGATVVVEGRGSVTIDELLGDGTDPTVDHLLGDGEIVTSIELPPPWPDEHAAYFRSISRFEAEWPLVEAVGRVRRDADGVVVDAAVAVGGVATVPLALPEAAHLLVGTTLDEQTIDHASRRCADGANPLPETGYKVDLLVATVREVLERIAAASTTG